MPPRKRLTDDSIIQSDVTVPGRESRDVPIAFLREGQIVNLVTGGRTLTGYEVLGLDDRFIKFRGNMTVAPQTEIVLIPWHQVEAIGLTDER